MYKPYAKLMDDTEVVFSTPLTDDGFTKVRFEKPDEKYFFKVLELLIPSYKIEECIGFSESEQERLLKYAERNAALLLTLSEQGGWENAQIY